MFPRPTSRNRRWAVFGAGLTASLLPALLLSATWAQPGRFASTLRGFWAEILFGPVTYWLRVLFGHPGPHVIHPMPGVSTWVYAICLPLAFAHPLKPRPFTGWVTVAAFGVWYGWAFLILNSFEY